MTTQDVLIQVVEERVSQDRTWGPQDHEPAMWLAILTEEVGEVATAVQNMAFGPSIDPTNYLEELVQVAAVAVAAVESFKRQAGL